MTKLQSTQSGITGEYFVAAELSKRGYIASLTLKNTKGVDILVANEDASKFIGIQVKTKQNAKKRWLLSEKNEDFCSKNLYYVFVDLKTDSEPSVPDYHIVPSKDVADSIKEGHKNFLKSNHNDTTMREFLDKNDAYLNKWDILKI
ncbi:MAG: hypothetical protein Ta2F_11880 [Termitinemataceae bacterium]|nr:MAG: hypothetical protein Ta2F_11880 [Termitinemataceae bacterium]